MSGTIHVYGHQKFLDVEHVDGKNFTFLHGARKLDQLGDYLLTRVVNHQCT